jgi:GNAT superfamily N-acetyltransferase
VLLLELFEMQAIPQSKFTGELADILYNLVDAKLIPKSAINDHEKAFNYLEKKAINPLVGTKYRYAMNTYAGDDINRPEVNLAIIDPASKKIVGVVFLEKYRYGRIGDAWHVSSLAVVPEYRGQGLAEKLEADLAVGTYGLTVKSGERQTPGSIALWNRMANHPQVEMFKVRADRAGVDVNPVRIHDGRIANYPSRKNEFLIMRPRQKANNL